ncbi:hypothetical protein RUND412_011589, partial [Rhizina undulata]
SFWRPRLELSTAGRDFFEMYSAMNLEPVNRSRSEEKSFRSMQLPRPVRVERMKVKESEEKDEA